MTEQTVHQTSIQQVARATLLIEKETMLLPSKELEISTYCKGCNEFDQTVFLGLTTTSRCRKCGHKISIQLDRINVTYLPDSAGNPEQEAFEVIEIRYYFSGSDLPTAPEDDLETDESSISWGRISITLCCLHCHEFNKHAIQNNIERPLRLTCTNCNAHLLSDTAIQPQFSVIRAVTR